MTMLKSLQIDMEKNKTIADLLAALKAIEEAAEWTDRPVSQGTQLNNVLKLAKAAIAKAEGR